MYRCKFKFIIVLLPLIVLGQVQNEKVVNQQVQSWFSSINTIKFNDHWALLADFQVRRNDFVDSDSFYFVRGAMAYMPDPKKILAFGYGHMWVAPSNPNWNTFSNEDRIYQQFQFSSKMGKVSVSNRFRNEQRWQQIIVNDLWNGDKRFTDRVRYSLSFDIPIFKKKTLPSLVISDEIFIQFGKDVVYNTFDQNGLFIGIKQAISPKLSFDFGYMNVYQQKYSGYQYDMNHTLRLFFYYNNSLKSLTHFGNHTSGAE